MKEEQRVLKNQIWSMANKVRAQVDGWDFKNYVLGALFYRFISENFTAFMSDKEHSYDLMFDADISHEVKDSVIKTLGYFIYPSQLFQNVVKNAPSDNEFYKTLKGIFTAIEDSAIGYSSDKTMRGLFSNFDISSNRLGFKPEEKNSRLLAILNGVASLELPKDSNMDLFGDSYEFLMHRYALTSGRHGGEYFTPQEVSDLLSRLVMHDKDKINAVYDPTCGSGSLLLQFREYYKDGKIEEGFFGQEVNHVSYGLARMNMMLHNVTYTKFHIEMGDTLVNPFFKDMKFDAIVSNPPYSIKWAIDNYDEMGEDDRFSPAGAIAPQSKADWAFIMHSLSYLSHRGRAAILCFPGSMYRSGSEQIIRKYLINNNYVEAVIELSPDLFYGTSTSVVVLVLSKNKADTNIQFIRASGPEFFTKTASNNILEPKHVDNILDIFSKKETIKYLSKMATQEEVKNKEFDLSIDVYVERKLSCILDYVNIGELEKDILRKRRKIDQDSYIIEDLIKKLEIDKYKDQDIEWCELGELCKISRGREMKRDYIYSHPGDYPVYSSQTMKKGEVGRIDTYDQDGTYITWATDGLYAGKVFYQENKKFTVTSGAGLIENKDPDKLDLKFLYHFLSLVSKKYVRIGHINSKLTINMMSKVMFPLLSLEIQTESARLLSVIEDLTVSIEEQLENHKNQYECYRYLLLNFEGTE